MEGLSDEQVMEQLSAVDAVLDGMKHDSEESCPVVWKVFVF